MNHKVRKGRTRKGHRESSVFSV